LYCKKLIILQRYTYLRNKKEKAKKYLKFIDFQMV